MTTAADRAAVANVIRFCEARGIPAPAPLPPPVLNYPAATEEHWLAAGRMIRSHLLRAGYSADRAEEVAQAWAVEELTRNRRRACPANPRIAAAWAVKRARRHGPAGLTKVTHTAQRRISRTGQAEPQPVADPVAVVDARRASLDPARIAAAGESLAERCPRLVRIAADQGTTPAGLALQAAGWRLDDDDEGRLAVVTSAGPGYTPPAAGCRGLHDTDPNPDSREAARMAAVNDARRVAGLPPA